MGVNFELAVKAEYIAAHVKHQRGRGDMPSELFLSEAYNMLMGDHQHAEEILKLYEAEVARDLERGVSSISKFKYKELGNAESCV